MKRKLFFVFICIFAGVLFYSCNKTEEFTDGKTLNGEKVEKNLNDVLTAEELKRLPLLNETHSLSDEQIISQAESIIDLLNQQDVTTKAAPKNRAIQDLRKVTINSNLKTKSGEDETSEVYICNFSDDGGYAIISGDDRVSGVLSYSGEGNLQDTIDNPGLAMFLDQVEDYIQVKLDEFQNLEDSIYDSMVEKLENMEPSATKGTRTWITYYSYGAWTPINSVGKKVSTLWHQSSPYNNKAPLACSGVKAPAGCVSIAAAQVMAYHKTPAKLGTTTFDWNAMTQYPHVDSWSSSITTLNQVASLVNEVGVGIGTTYRCDQSGAATSNVVNFLRNNSYNTGNYQGYNYSVLRNSLLYNRPVIVDGYTTETVTKKKILGITIKTTYSYSEGHAWVVDAATGLRQTVTATTYYYENGYLRDIYASVSYNYADVVHCNWGWGSNRYNGYYQQGVFDLNRPYSLDDSYNYISKKYNFRYLIPHCVQIFRNR
jgi:hypothetical protein